MNFRKNSKGITLIALIVTIIVLLILAGVSLSLVAGGDGILGRAENAVNVTNEAKAREKLELVLAELMADQYVDKSYNENDYIDDRIEENEMFVDGDVVTVDGWQFEIDRDVLKILGKGEAEESGGTRPEISNLKITLEDGTEPGDYSQIIGTPLIINFDSSINDGEIKGVSINDGEIQDISSAIPFTTDGTRNTVSFKIIGAVNSVEYSRTLNVSLMKKYIPPYDSLANAAKAISETSYMKIQIEGKDSDGNDEVVTHDINAIVYDGDLVLDGTTQVTGSTLSSNVYSFGSASTDIGTASANAKNTVILKVNGNLTINSGVSLTACRSTYGGPKGFMIYCTGTITNNGTITMTARGAKAVGQNVYIWKNADGTYEYVPAVGIAGQAGIKNTSQYSRPTTPEVATDRKTGGRTEAVIHI